jgi:hypothetical protein
VARSSRKHYINFAVFSLFSLTFASFLVVAAYYYFTDGKDMTMKSFAPGVPAFFLFFLARKEWRSARAVRNMERRPTADPTAGIDELMKAAAERMADKKKPVQTSVDDIKLP